VSALRAWLMLLLASVLCGARLVIVADADAKPYAEAAAGAAASGLPMERWLVSDPKVRDRAAAAGAEEVWLALGPQSALLVSTVKTAHKSATLLRQMDLPAGMPGATLEVPLVRQAAWLRVAFPGRRHAVALMQPGRAAGQEERIRAAAHANGLQVILAEASTAAEVVPALEAALRQMPGPGMVWLMSDTTVITADTIGPLVQEALSRRVPVVGFSPYFLKVGAVAAVQVDYTELGKQALRLANQSKVEQQAPEHAHLVVVGGLAQRLGVTVAPGKGVEVRP
jgi:putative ABC transport system substrate-binding protein